MKSKIEDKLNRIANIWNNFIWEYKFCSDKIKFTTDVQSNYFGDILGNFQDTFDVIFKERTSDSFADKFSNQISLLQSIYIQQDFIEELLIIFKCDINKGDLKNNSNYSINRDLRNELIGHPIRKTLVPIEEDNSFECTSCGNKVNKPKYKSVLLSSTLFSYNSDNNKIKYLKYHKENNYEYESLTFDIPDIIERHVEFLNFYFDKIIAKLKDVLIRFDEKLSGLQGLIETQDFKTCVKILTINYESIFNTSYLYDSDSLNKIYNKSSEHKRYQNFIDSFYFDLKDSIIETRKYIIELFESKQKVSNKEIPKREIKLINHSNAKKNNPENAEQTYHYELAKLGSRRNAMDFDFFSGLLKLKCSDNQLVIDELKHMENNILNEIEYFTSLKLIRCELKL